MKQGALLEQLVAAIQDHLKGQADVTIELNKKLPDRDGHKREIDVYVTRKCQGLPITFAFECKDYNKPVDVKVVDAFVGKCQELPEITNRVIVSSSGFTKLAVESASKRGVQLCSIEDVKANNFFSLYMAHDVQVRVEIACSDWQLNFIDWVRTDLVDRTKDIRYVDDNSIVDLWTIVYQRLYSLPMLTQLGAGYMKLGKRPYNSIVRMKFERDMYVEDLQGEKHIIEDMDIPVKVDVLLTPMAINSQKNYAPIQNGDKVTITEFGSERQEMNLVSLDSDNGHTILLKSNDGTLRKPNISIKGNFGESNV